MRWMYRKRKTARKERKRTALAWLEEHPDVARRLLSEAAAHVTWESMWLGLEDTLDVDIPHDVRRFLQKQ
jgi:hypothetical protein